MPIASGELPKRRLFPDKPGAAIWGGSTERMFKRLYAWVIALSASPHAPWALGLVAFAESSVFPIPPDVMLIPMCVAQPRRAWLFAGVCTVASVVGGALGYYIGDALYQTVGQWLISVYGGADKMETLRESYAKWGALFILIKGVTPIPYKFVTIASGALGYSFPLFIALSVVTRGARFFIVAGVLHRFGDPIKAWLETHFGLFIALLIVAIVAGVFIATRVF